MGPRAKEGERDEGKGRPMNWRGIERLLASLFGRRGGTFSFVLFSKKISWGDVMV